MNRGTSNDQRTQIAAEWFVRLTYCAPAEAELAAWRKWLEQDSDTKRLFEDLQRLWADTKRIPPPAETLAELLAVEEQRAHGSANGPKKRWWVLGRNERRTLPLFAAALTASAAFAIVALIVAISLRGNPPQVESLATRVGQNETVLLQDGSRVDLGGLSAVRVNYTRHRRLLKMLAGEAYFQDRDYAKWPFVVAAGDLQVRAIGTAFDVERDKHLVAVSVVRGSVELALTRHRAGATVAGTDKQTGSGPKLILSSGERAVVYPDGSMREYAIDPAEVLAWRKGRLEFADATLGEVIEAVDRYATRPIVIASPAVGVMRFTGTVFVRGTGEWADSLPAVFPLTVDLSDPKAIVLRRPPKLPSR